MVTKEIAAAATHGTIFHHASKRNSDGTPMRVRVSGQCKTWVTRPDDFKLPVKYGLYESGYITPMNAADWTKA